MIWITLAEMEPVYLAGADDVIPEELETSVERFVAVLRPYLVPQAEIEESVGQVLANPGSAFRFEVGGNRAFAKRVFSRSSAAGLPEEGPPPGSLQRASA